MFAREHTTRRSCPLSLPEFLTCQDAARELGYTSQHTGRLVRDGQLKGAKLGRDWIIEKDSVGDFLASRENLDLPLDLDAGRELGTPPSYSGKAPTAITNGDPPPPTPRATGGRVGALKWVLYQGSSPKTLEALDPGSVNCVVTSPPYYWQRDYGVEGQMGHEPSIDEYVDALVDCFREVKRVLTDDGVVFLNLGDTFYSAKGRPHGRDPKHRGRQVARQQLRAVDGPGLGLPRKSLIGIPWRVALAMQDESWVLRSSIIWKRPAPLPEPSARDRPWRSYEHVFLFSKAPRYWFDRSSLGGDEDFWQISARPDNPGSHFAPYPVEFAEKCVRCGCPEGGTVLDPFAGSGTTLIAALRAGRNAIGVELNPDYCRFASERMSTTDFQQSLPLEAAE
jgi:excisionase family DNA binding protein